MTKEYTIQHVAQALCYWADELEERYPLNVLQTEEGWLLTLESELESIDLKALLDQAKKVMK